MNIERLRFEHYRNLKDGELVPKPGINVIYGKNAQGKTNLLEGMWLFTGGRSFRGSKDSELVEFHQPQAKLTLDFFSEERKQRAELTIRNGRRAASLNGVEKKTASGLVGKFCAVIFSPEHLSLVKEGPAMRRAFIDSALCQIKPTYAKLLGLYTRTLNQRNSLLKDIPRNSALLATLEDWDRNLARYGGEIVKDRASYLQRLNLPAQQVYSGISQNQEEFASFYKCTFAENDAEPNTLATLLFHKLKETRKDDLAAGFTTVGPHRDDLEITVDGLSSRTYASQGQQRSIVLALKLAEAQVLGERLEEPPVVFLDDVMSELDAGRQDYLLNHLENKQVFITCCEPESVKRLIGGGRCEVSGGRVTVQKVPDCI